jgi:hypothetical protein
MPPNNLALSFHKATSGVYPKRTQRRSISTSNALHSDTGSSHVHDPETSTKAQPWKDESRIPPAYEDSSAWPEIFSRLPDWTNTQAIDHQDALGAGTIFGASSNYLDPYAFEEAALLRILDMDTDAGSLLNYGDTTFVQPQGFIDTTYAPVISKQEPLRPDNIDSRKQSIDRSSSSSLVILTPPDPSPEFGDTGSQHSVSDEHLYLEAAHHFGGPCSNAWQLPQWVRFGS